jgi:hypothetical protein
VSDFARNLRKENIMSKFANVAFNAGVSIVDSAYAAKRGAVKVAQATAAQTKSVAATSKEVGTSFWAGMKFAHQRIKGQAIPKLEM